MAALENMLSSLLMALGSALALYGTCSGIAWLLFSCQWVLMILVGCTCAAAGATLHVWQHGALWWLPASVSEALLRESVYSVLMRIRHLRSQVRAPKTGKSQSKSQEWIRLLTLCVLELDDELVREIIEGMDSSFRNAVFRPGLVHFLPSTAQRLVIGRGEAISEDTDLDMLLTCGKLPEDNKEEDISPSKRQVNALVDVIHSTREQCANARSTATHGSLDSTEVDCSLKPAPEASLPPAAVFEKAQTGMLALAFRIIFYELVQKPWRALMKKIRGKWICQQVIQLYMWMRDKWIWQQAMQLYAGAQTYLLWATTTACAGYFNFIIRRLEPACGCKKRTAVKFQKKRA